MDTFKKLQLDEKPEEDGTVKDQTEKSGTEKDHLDRLNTDGTAQTGPTKKRYSGAQRRRYKRLKSQQTTQVTQVVQGKDDDGKGGCKGNETRKRTLPEHTTPSPTTSRPDKRTRTETSTRTKTGTGKQSGTYAQTASKVLKLALVKEGYPEEKLTPEEIGGIKKKMKNLILEVPKGTKPPKFEGMWERDGAVVFACTDEETGTWLKSLFPENKINNITLRVLPFEELLKRHRVVVHVEDPDMTAEEAMSFLTRQNEELEAEDWIVVKSSYSRGDKSAHFAALVNDKTIKALETCHFRPYCGIIRVTVQVLDRDHRGKKKTEEGEEKKNYLNPKSR